MKKLLILLFLLPLLFGCTVEYDITIYDDKVSENFNLLTINDADNLENIEYDLNSLTFARKSQVFDTYSNEKVPGISYYNKNKLEKDNQIGINYYFDFDIENIYDSYAINQCYDKFSAIVEEDYIILSTNKFNKCIVDNNVDEIKIHLKTNHRVKENNADEIDKYNYYWNINKSNYDDKNIYIMLYRDKYVFNYEGEAIPYIIGSVIVAILILIVIIVLKRKSRNNNKV